MTTAVAVREPNQPAPLLQMIESRRETIGAVLPANMDVDRFIKVAWVAITKNPAIQECTPASILTSLMEAAELGLEPTGSLNRAWLVPQRVNVAPKGQQARYEKRAELRIGYQGLGDLARNSGEISKVESRVVYEGDTFEARYGTDPGIVHLPSFDTTDPTKIEKVYAVAYFKDGSVQFDVMKKDQIDAIRARAPGANSGPWSTDYAEMARKTVVRRLMKSLPLTSETQAAVQRDIDREVAVVAVAPGENRTAALRQQLQAKLAPPTDAPGRDEPADAPTDATAPESSAEEQTAGGTEDAVVVCGNRAADGLMEGNICLETAGHKGSHKNAAGSWPS